ncbi:hypothetical protein DFH07DRAFT_766840 [Mycena maculata]|uniref:Uncharacterized protein n=1 Tax=Mycena maculata TaxID=230809 RepID=A0AAD7NVI5_9AGAR|nr:hypothetical protein DFH07DRAFT_766840 [Mycena maculata]
MDLSPAIADDYANTSYDFDDIRALRVLHAPPTDQDPEDEVFGGTSISQLRKKAISLPQVEAMPEATTNNEEEDEQDELESPTYAAQQSGLRILSPVVFSPPVTYNFPSFKPQVGGGWQQEATPPAPEDIPATRLRGSVRGTAHASPITQTAIQRRANMAAAAIPSASTAAAVPSASIFPAIKEFSKNPDGYIATLGFEPATLPPPPPGFEATSLQLAEQPLRRLKAKLRTAPPGAAASTPIDPVATATTVGPSNTPSDTAATAAAAGPSTAITAAAVDPSTAISPPASMNGVADDEHDHENDGENDLASSATPDAPGRLRADARRALDAAVSQLRTMLTTCATNTGLSERCILRAFAKEVEGASPHRPNLWNRYQPYSISAEHRLEEMWCMRGEEAEDDDEDLTQEETKRAYHTFIEFYGEDVAEILSLHEELAREEGDQTHLERSRLLSKVFGNGEKMVSRVLQKYGLEGCIMFVGPHLNEDGQIAKCFLTPGLSELAATLHLSHDDFLGAVKLTAYNAQNRAVNKLAGRPPISEGAITSFYVPETTAAGLVPSTSAAATATTAARLTPSTSAAAAATAAAAPSTSAAATAAGPTAIRTATKNMTEAKRQAAKARTQSHEQNKKSMQTLLRKKAVDDLGFDIFADSKRPGTFVWANLGSWLRQHRIRILGFPTDARLPGLSRQTKGASAWHVIDVRAFNRAIRARSKEGQGLRFEKFSYSSADELTILSHNYSVPVVSGPLSTVRSVFRSSGGKALPCVDGANDMWMACFDLAKSPKRLQPTCLTDVDALRLETVASGLPRTEFDEDDYLDTDNEAGDQDGEDDADEGDSGEAQPQKPSAKGKGKRPRTNDPEYATDTEPESEEATLAPPRKRAAAAASLQKKAPETVRVTRAQAAQQMQEGGGKPKGKGKEKEKPKAKAKATQKLRVRFAPDTVSDADADDDDDRPLLTTRRAKFPAQRARPLRIQEDSDVESVGPSVGPGRLQAFVEVPFHTDISPRHRPQPVVLKEVQLDPFVASLIGTPESKMLKRKHDAAAPALNADAESTSDGANSSASSARARPTNGAAGTGASSTDAATPNPVPGASSTPARARSTAGPASTSASSGCARPTNGAAGAGASSADTAAPNPAPGASSTAATAEPAATASTMLLKAMMRMLMGEQLAAILQMTKQ